MPWYKQIPNTVTLGRGLVIIYMLIMLDWYTNQIRAEMESGVSVILGTIFVLYLVGTILDFVDGWLAVLLDARTEFGAQADPFVDKMTMVGCLFYWQTLPWTTQWIGPAFATVIVFRMLLVSVFRSKVTARGMKMDARWHGKLTTLLVFYALGASIGVKVDGIPQPMVELHLEWVLPILKFAAPTVAICSGLLYYRLYRTLTDQTMIDSSRLMRAVATVSIGENHRR